MHCAAGIAALILVLGSASHLVAEDGLVGYWRFDTAAGSIADLSGHGHAAQVSGGKVVMDDGQAVLALDGSQKIVVPSGVELNLQPGFSIELKIKLSAATDYGLLIFKADQYQLRIDGRSEGGLMSFFVYAGGEWEPRIHCGGPASAPGAIWWPRGTASGRSFGLNGVPFLGARHGKPPTADDSPLSITSNSAPGDGIRGAIAYAKIYRRVLSPAEILQKAQGTAEAVGPQAATTSFDFARTTDLEGWTAREGATATPSAKGLVVGTKSPQSLIINRRLGANIDKKDFLTVRMSVDKGGQARLIYVTTKGAGQIPFPTVADRKPHGYVIEPWTQIGWGGNLLELGLAPSELGGSTACIEHLQIGEEPQAPPEIQVTRIFTESTLPRAQRPDRIMARLLNTAGPGRNLVATLSAPQDVTLTSPAAQIVPRIDHQGEAEVAWNVEAARPVTGPFRVTVSGPDLAEPASAVQKLTFYTHPHLAKSSYVPPPVPAKTKYTLWTHYCPLWKEGTHTGWKLIEPWPERKPVIGWYNEGTPEVADWHIKCLLEHGISGIVYCWYRSNLNGPVEQSIGHAIHDGLLKARYLPLMKFGIMWENGCGQGIGSAEDMTQNLLPFWIDNYFSNPSYLRIDGKPVLYVWVPSNVTRQSAVAKRCAKLSSGCGPSAAAAGWAACTWSAAWARESGDAGGHGPRGLGRQQRLRQRVAAAGSGHDAGRFLLRPVRRIHRPARGHLEVQAAVAPAARHHRGHDGLGLAPLERNAVLLVRQHTREVPRAVPAGEGPDGCLAHVRPREEDGHFLLLERVRRRPLHRADPGLRLFLSRRDPRGILRRASGARGRGPGGRRVGGRRFLVSQGPSVGPRRQSSDLTPNRVVGRATGRLDRRDGVWPDRSSPGHFTSNVNQRRPCLFLPALEASRQPDCPSDRRDAIEPVGRPRPTFLVHRDVAASRRRRQRCDPDDGRRPMAPLQLRRGEKSALGRLRYVVAVRSGHAKGRDRRTPLSPAGIAVRFS